MAQWNGNISKNWQGVEWEQGASIYDFTKRYQAYILTNVGGRLTKAIKKVCQEELHAIAINDEIPWIPRTGKAQEGLKFNIDIVGSQQHPAWDITFYYDPAIVKAYRPNAPSSDADGYFRYGYSLEFMHGKRYAILVKTVEGVFISIMNEIQRLFDTQFARNAANTVRPTD